MECNGHKVVKDIIYGSGSKKYRYCKHISKQRLFGLPRKLMSKGKHFILIRNPLDPSFEKVHRPSFLELGLGELVSIYSDLCQMGTPPPVIDADELQRDPEIRSRQRYAVFAMIWRFHLKPLCLHGRLVLYQKVEYGHHGGTRVCTSQLVSHLQRSTLVRSLLSHYDFLEQSLPLYNILRSHVKRKSSLLISPLAPPSLPVPENAKLLAWVDDELLPCEMAKVSVFDSVVQGGDSVWEGLRVYKGKEDIQT
ncbi:branched-chain-amino-acid aminotransferase-like protein 1 isoform X1 [Raphanus sativus]|uniref:Branched-chain-amino-acid aminotransferase-like protein 1 isoform X1 n=1 Tax=Raphanus sativus TaxID=3726 RepID=A0A9W3CP06_RAPSA|nr:branched-chain-amino-acid aminotransferase-like protein 1 isoform X1 [Raphanus sativus]